MKRTKLSWIINLNDLDESDRLVGRVELRGIEGVLGVCTKSTSVRIVKEYQLYCVNCASQIYYRQQHLLTTKYCLYACLHSTVVVHLFCKQKVLSSILNVGFSFCPRNEWMKEWMREWPKMVTFFVHCVFQTFRTKKELKNDQNCVLFQTLIINNLEQTNRE